MRSEANKLLDKLYAAEPVEIKYGKPVDKVVINRKTYKYECMVCHKPNDYWWMYCAEHEAQCDREMDEATE